MNRKKRMSIGLDLHCVSDLNETLHSSTESGYDFISIPLCHPRFKREFIKASLKNRDGPLTRSDMLLQSQDWSTFIVAKLSSWLQLDSNVEIIRRNSEMALKQELLFASHLSIPALIIPLKSENCANLARTLFSHLFHGKKIYQKLSQIWVNVPMVAPKDIAQQFRNDITSESGSTDTWQWWRKFLGICNSDKMIGLALEVSSDTPSDDVIKRWLGEPVRCLMIPTSLFLTNKAGYPVLSRAHQILLLKFFKHKIQGMVTGINRHGDIRYYEQYLENLLHQMPQSNDVDSFASGYEDYLQCPLQPLMDNLESQTYEIFEKDPVKYTEYHRAVCKAFVDRVPEDKIDSQTLTVMVLGAGRGPLVTACLNAAESTKRKITLYAIEKNPNAVITLMNLRDEVWHDRVTVVSTDMREWNPPEKADIIVSELLGSFGDNELSPECLDSAQAFLKDDGISIPRSYTSYICPIQSVKLHNEVRQCYDSNQEPHVKVETPYVVFMKNYTKLSEPLDLFTFEHPNKDLESSNARYKILNFKINMNSMIHGFAGFFETVLYDDVMLSILPSTYSTGMLSWFPIFFPIKDPLYLTKDCDLELHFWRCVSDKNVWYEWGITNPHVGTIHNPCGRSSNIGL